MSVHVRILHGKCFVYVEKRENWNSHQLSINTIDTLRWLSMRYDIIALDYYLFNGFYTEHHTYFKRIIFVISMELNNGREWERKKKG